MVKTNPTTIRRKQKVKDCGADEENAQQTEPKHENNGTERDTNPLARKGEKQATLHEKNVAAKRVGATVDCRDGWKP